MFSVNAKENASNVDTLTLNQLYLKKNLWRKGKKVFTGYVTHVYKNSNVERVGFFNEFYTTPTHTLPGLSKFSWSVDSVFAHFSQGKVDSVRLFNNGLRTAVVTHEYVGEDTLSVFKTYAESPIQKYLNQSSGFDWCYEMKNGKANGKSWFYLYKNERDTMMLRSVGNYVNDTLHGKVIQYHHYYDKDSFLIQYDYTMRNGKRDGVSYSYNEHGDLIDVTNFVNDKKEGEYLHYYIGNNQIFVKIVYAANEEIEYLKYSYNGKLLYHKVGDDEQEVVLTGEVVEHSYPFTHFYYKNYDEQGNAIYPWYVKDKAGKVIKTIEQ